MPRFSLAAAFLIMLPSAIKGAEAQEGNDADAWAFLPATMPSPLSDMAISLLTVGGGGVDGKATDADAKRRIVITGGCDNPEGNKLGDDGYFSCPSLSNKAYAFDPIRHGTFQAWNGEFETLPDMPRARARHASAVANGNVCVFGGRNATDALVAEVDCYDPIANEWTEVTSLPVKYQSSDHTAYATKDNKVYLIAGYDAGYSALDQVTVIDMSDFSAIAYSDGPKLNEKRGDIDVAILDGDVYVSGGFTHEDEWSKPKNSVEKYNIETGRWSDVDSLNKERGDKQLVAIGGKVYALGGETKVDVSNVPEADLNPGSGSEVLDSVEVLDPTEDVHGGMAEWRSLAGMPGQLFRFGAAEWEVANVNGEKEEGFIFVFGGQRGYNSDCKCFETSDKVMVFDIAHAEKKEVESNSRGAGTIDVGAVVVLRTLSLVVSGLLWFGL